MSLDLDQRLHERMHPAAHVLASGASVFLRPARARDLDALRSLAARNSVLCDDLELARLVRSDAASRLVLCASTTIDQVGDRDPQASHRDLGAEQVVGVGVIELGRWATMPSLVLVDPAVGDGLARLLADALIEHARDLAAAGQVA